MTDSTYIG